MRQHTYRLPVRKYGLFHLMLNASVRSSVRFKDSLEAERAGSFTGAFPVPCSAG